MVRRKRRAPPTAPRRSPRRGRLLFHCLLGCLAFVPVALDDATATDTEQQAQAAVPPPIVQQPLPLAEYLEPIVARNLFNSTPVEAVPAEPSADLVRSDLPVRLIATSVASDPRWSSAIVSPEKKAPTRVVWLGSSIGDTVVDAIEAPWLDAGRVHHPARLILRHGGQLTYVEEDNPAPKVRKKKKRSKKRNKRNKRNKRKKGR